MRKTSAGYQAVVLMTWPVVSPLLLTEGEVEVDEDEVLEVLLEAA